MMSITIKCDSCDNDLTKGGSCPSFRLCLSAELKPNDTDIICAVMVCPPIAEEQYFCGLTCLKAWATKTE